MVVSTWNLNTGEVRVGVFLGLTQLAGLAKSASHRFTGILPQKEILRKTVEDISMHVYAHVYTHTHTLKASMARTYQMGKI